MSDAEKVGGWPIVNQHVALIGKHKGYWIFEVLLEPKADEELYRRYVLARAEDEAIRLAIEMADDPWRIFCDQHSRRDSEK